MSIANKLAKPVTEILEDIARKVPKALGHGHHRIAAATHKAADDFDTVERDLADKARGRGHHGAPGAAHHDPNVGAGTGASAAAAARPGERAAADAERAARASAARRHVEGDPHGNTRPGDSVHGCGDPVDVATGRTFLAGRDVVLPGALPLVFVRRTDSGYHAGRWFGAAWSSTVDQRLEVDDQGVIFVHEAGLLLAYPVPVAGQSVVPAHGPRWPLTLAADGTYVVRDTEGERTWAFASPQSGIARLVAISDRNGHRITFEYDEQGAPARVVHDGGHVIEVSTRDGRVVALHLAGAASGGTGLEIVRYGYAGGRLTEVFDSSGIPLRFGYDDAGRVASWTDRNGNSYRYTFDEHGRCVAERGADGHLAYRFDYGDRDPATGLRTTTATDSLGAVRRYVVNDSLQVVAETDPLGHEIRTERDQHHRVLSVTDALGRIEKVAYDEGRPTVFTRPDGRAVRVAYNALGLPVLVVDADGSIWRRVYDRRGNLLATTDPAGAVTRRAYDERGHLTAVTDALGHVTTVVCDAAGLPVRVTDPLGAETRYERDAFGRLTAVIDPLGAVTRTEWTVEGRPARRIGPDGAVESWTYDGEGNCLTHTDRLGGVTRSTYGPFRLLTSVTRPDGARHTFVHDTELRLRAVVNPAGLRWEYDYDAAGRPVRERDFHGRTVRYTHDAVGRPTSRTNALGQTIRYTYDALGDIAEIAADGDVTSFTHDPLGRPTAAVNADHRLAWTYDVRGRVLSEQVDDRPALTYRYDARGNRTGRITPSGAVSSWAYDSAGRPTLLTAGERTLAFVHDAAGRETRRRLDDSLTWDNVYDPAGRTTSRTVTAAGRVISGRAYTYRADGCPTAVDEHGAGRRDYTVDGAGRVTAVTGRNWTETYAYDALGQQTHADWNVPGVPTDATGPRTRPPVGCDGIRIATAGRVRYEYDAQGRVVLRRKRRISRPPETWRYTWDAYDRLAGVTTPDGVRWRYRYDPLGRRTAKERLAADGTVAERTDFTWDGPLLAEQSARAAGRDTAVTLTWDHRGLLPLVQRESISAGHECGPGPGQPHAAASREEIDSRFFAIVTDVIGTPTALVDSGGDIAWRGVATLWGTTVWSTADTAYTPLRFVGQYHDAESGLHYNVHRYYDPETAQYTSPDPLGLSAGPSPLSYVHNPLRAADPLGLNELPLGERGNPFATRQDAERAAYDLGGIPHDENPMARWSVGADVTRRGGPNYVYDTNETHWGEMRQYETENGSVVIVEHTHDPAGSHFHVGRAKPDGTGEPRNFVNFGWNGQDPVRDEFERYLKTDKPGGDHHLFYRGGVVCPG